MSDHGPGRPIQITLNSLFHGGNGIFIVTDQRKPHVKTLFKHIDGNTRRRQLQQSGWTFVTGVRWYLKMLLASGFVGALCLLTHCKESQSSSYLMVTKVRGEVSDKQVLRGWTWRAGRRLNSRSSAALLDPMSPGHAQCTHIHSEEYNMHTVNSFF